MEEQLAVSGKGDNGLINLFGKTLDVLEGETGNLNHDDIAVLVNTPDGMERLKEIYGELQKVVGLLIQRISGIYRMRLILFLKRNQRISLLLN